MELLTLPVNPDFGIRVEPMFDTSITEFKSGRENRRKNWAFPKRKITLQYSMLHETEIKDLWQFYIARSGAFEAFYFFLPSPRHWYGEYVGTGDGTIATFDLPSRNTDQSTLKIYLNGVEQTSGWSFSAGTGQYGADQIIFTTAPAVGDIITADLYGELRLKCRFAVDNLPDELFRYMLYNTGIELLEVRP